MTEREKLEQTVIELAKAWAARYAVPPHLSEGRLDFARAEIALARAVLALEAAE